MSRNSLNTHYLILTGVIIVAIVAVFVVIIPAFKGWQQQQEKLADMQAVVAEREAFLLNLDRKIVELQQQQEHEKRLEVVLPTDSSVDDVTKLLYTWSVTSGTTVTTIDNTTQSEITTLRAARARGQAQEIPANVETVRLSVGVRGTYQQYRAFLDLLEKSPRLADIISIKMTRSETQPDVIEAKMDIRFYTYHAQGNG